MYLYFLLLCFLRLVVRPVVVVILTLFLLVSLTPLWSQNSDLRLSGSEAILRQWETLSGKLQSELNGLQMDLSAALHEAKQSAISSERLTHLYENSLQRLTSLENYNLQISERMEKRDMDLYYAYEEIDELKLSVVKKNVAIANRNTVIAILGGIIVAYVLFRVGMFLVKKFARPIL